MNNAQDGRIARSIKNKLASRGFDSQHLTISTSNGQVTLSGSVQFAHQQKAALKAIAGLTGGRRVVSQMTIKPAARRT